EQNNNSQQKIKALIYQLKFRNIIEEDADIKNIRQVDSLVQNATGVSKALLQNLSANLYWSYVHQNRYKLLQRTTSTSEINENLTSWSLPHFYEKISNLFLQSLKPETELKKINIKDYTTLIDTGKHAIQLRPTLYDVLTNNALKYFTSNESTITEPAQKFVINNPKAFSPATDFIQQQFSTTDTTSLSWKALKLYQNLIQFHLQDAYKAALIDISIERLKFVFKNAVLSQKDDLYLSALNRIIEKYAPPLQSKAIYLLATWYYHKGLKYDAYKNPKYKDALKEALDLC